MADTAGPVTGATYLEAPCDARIKAVYDYWSRVRGDRAMPSRSDFDPAAIP